MVELLYGDIVRDSKKEEIKNKVARLKNIPHLKIIYADGFDEASKIYVRNKIKFCNEAGIDYELVKLNWENSTKEAVLNEIIGLIKKYNDDDSVTGYFVQLKLPYGIDESMFIDYFRPEKDIDAFSRENLGRLYKNEEGLVPCTAQGIIDILDYYNIDLEGKDVVVINRSQLVGIPVAALLINRNATVTVCHSKTKDLKKKVRNADIVITAVGKANFMDSSWFKSGQVIIDVSMNRDENGKLCGDVSKKVYKSKKDLKITPVPRGCGALTILNIGANILKSAEMQENK